MIMELTYTKVGDYYIPDLALDDDTEYEIGIYGRMREKFLKEHDAGNLHLSATMCWFSYYSGSHCFHDANEDRIHPHWSDCRPTICR